MDARKPDSVDKILDEAISEALRLTDPNHHADLVRGDHLNSYVNRIKNEIVRSLFQRFKPRA